MRRQKTLVGLTSREATEGEGIGSWWRCGVLFGNCGRTEQVGISSQWSAVIVQWREAGGGLLLALFSLYGR